jgi:hypothetical protein
VRARFFSNFATWYVHINNIQSPRRSGPMWNLHRFSTPFKFHKNHSSKKESTLKHSHLRSSSRIGRKSLCRYVRLRLDITSSRLSSGGPSRRSLCSHAVSTLLDALIDEIPSNPSGWSRTNSLTTTHKFKCKRIYTRDHPVLFGDHLVLFLDLLHTVW